MFRRYKLSDKTKKLMFSARQTFGHAFIRKFVPKLLEINVYEKSVRYTLLVLSNII